MKRIFITHIAPKDKILEYKVSSAACNFSYNLISGSIFDKVYSILPTYVLGKKSFVNTDGVEYIYSKWRWKNKLMKKLAPIVENYVLFKKIEKASSIWLYNMSMLNIWLVILLRIFKPSVKINIILLDFTPGSRLNSFFLKRINKCDGRILLANSPLFNKENSFTLPGVTPIVGTNYPTVEKIEKEFLISGMLNENIAMLSVLLPVFSKLPHLTLHITGIADNEEYIKGYADKYHNIKYHGLMDFDQYLALMGRTPFIISMRNPSAPENQCNFPSKIIESLLYNRIILSTIHYEQLTGIRYFEVPSDKESLTRVLEEIVAKDENELMLYANQSQLVSKMFNTDVWNDVITKIEQNECKK